MSSGPAAAERRAVVVLSVRLAVGLVLIVAGWIGSSREVALDRQSPWIAVTVVGAVVAAAAGALWLLQLRREVSARVLALVSRVEGLPSTAVAAGTDVVRVRRRGKATRLFHRPGCALVVGRVVTAGDAESMLAGGYEACEACRA